MRLIIAGGRDYTLSEEDYESLDNLHERYHFSEIVTGCASGADTCGMQWAREKGIPFTPFPADWSKGRSAGPERNEQMAKYADAVALFPGGRGTANMERNARKYGLTIFKRDKNRKQEVS